MLFTIDISINQYIINRYASVPIIFVEQSTQFSDRIAVYSHNDPQRCYSPLLGFLHRIAKDVEEHGGDDGRGGAGQGPVASGLGTRHSLPLWPDATCPPNADIGDAGRGRIGQPDFVDCLRRPEEVKLKN